MPEAPQEEPKRRSFVGPAVILLTLLTIVLAGFVFVAGAEQDERGPGDIELTAAQIEGRENFNYACSQCHALDNANAVATVGPDLDQLRPPEPLVLDAIEKGRSRGQGNMPARLFTGEDARNVADYVSAVAGKE